MTIFGIEAFKEEGTKFIFHAEFYYFKRDGLPSQVQGLKEDSINFDNISKIDLFFLKIKILDLGNRKVLVRNFGKRIQQEI